MIIRGFQKLTLVDYPAHVGAILFLGGCDFRCPFCQNASLLDAGSEDALSEEDVFSYLKKRKGMLDGVVVTGGEPTVQSDLIPFLSSLKRLGYAVKLDTNGYRPHVMKDAVREGVVDYIAMDIKNSLDNYARTVGISNFDPALIEDSLTFLLENHVEYELRTTVVKELHSDEDFEKIGKMCRGASNYFLQSFSDAGDILSPGFHSPSIEDLERYMRILRKNIENVSIRDR